MATVQNRQRLYAQETRRLIDILKQAKPKKIILFGSAATGMLHEDSDIDLCVLLEDDQNLPRFRRAQRLNRLLAANDYAWQTDVEFHVYSLREYEERLGRGDPFIREISKGRVLYER